MKQSNLPLEVNHESRCIDEVKRQLETNPDLEGVWLEVLTVLHYQGEDKADAAS